MSYHIFRMEPNGKYKKLRECDDKHKAKIYATKERAQYIYVPSCGVGTQLYQKGRLYGVVIEERENSYVIDRSSMFPEKPPVTYNKSDFYTKFYKGLLEGKPEIEQLEIF